MENIVNISYHAISDGRRIAALQLNAERALNALSLEMIRIIRPRLEEWAEDDGVAAVWIEGSGDKAFCAGGDVLALYRAMAEGRPSEAEPFFIEEYDLDYRIHSYSKPIIVWGNGIVMGGGLGLMVGADFRIVTESSRIAMPEIGIGLFPDVGGSWFLNRMPGRIGLFLGMTGAALNGADALFVDLADRFITHDRRRATLNALADADWSASDSDYSTISRVLRAMEQESLDAKPASQLRAHFDTIHALCDADTLDELIARLKSYDGDEAWLRKAAANVAAGSPTSMTIFWQQLRLARHASLAEVFRQELVLAANALRGGEFAEGVRALLVDKDRKPRWRYPSIEDLDALWIEQFFSRPWPDGEHPLGHLGAQVKITKTA